MKIRQFRAGGDSIRLRGGGGPGRFRTNRFGYTASSMAANPLAFLIDATPRQRRALAASTLGWMLDGMDVTLYAMALSELLRDLQLTKAQAGLLASLTLIASAAGGILFGFFADRFGRRAALILSIAIYSAFSGFCGMSTTVWQLAIFRVGVGLGMGGEWATGAALVSET